MCDFITPIASAIAAAAGSAGTAATVGAGLSSAFVPAAAASSGLTLGSLLSTVGTLASIGGTLYQGVQAQQSARAQAAALETQNAAERQLAAVEDQRLRARMAGEIARQRAELAGRGVSLDSPTSLLLGRAAAQELSFASQSVRSNAAARAEELSAAARLSRARGTQAMLGGTLSAATGLLTAAPKLWPGLADTRVLG